jgi:hypothetical protein
MRLLTAAGLLAFSAGTALAGYLVELDAGDRMTVDSYWEEGDRVHLMREGVDLNVPRGRIRSLRQVSGSGEADVRPQSASPGSPGACGDAAESQQTRDEIAAEQHRIEHHMIRVQQHRFEARARGDSPKTLRRLDREFERTQKRRLDTIRKLGDPPST